MAKQTTSTKQPVFQELKNTFHFFPFKNQAAPFIVIILLGLIFNLTSLHNEYALDDGIIIHQNDHVIKGVKGIKDIMTKDAYESFYRRMNATDQLAGGRYRPLSVVSFAIEQEFIGAYPKDGLYPQRCWDTNQNKKDDVEEDINDDGVFNEVDCQVKGASLRHFVNIITLIIGVILLFLFFRNYIFKDNHDLAFLAALIFLMHPIHSEAIANVKSRDEIFSLIFISLTFFFSFKYMKEKDSKTLFWAAFNFLLALLSKEYAVVLIILIPIAIYIYGGLEFNINKFLLALVGYLCLGAGLFLLTKTYSAYKLDEPGKALVYFMASAGAFVGGWKLFSKHYEEYKNAFIVLTLFIVSALIMLLIKQNHDIKALPGAKPNLSYWIFPFVYLVFGIFIFGSKKKDYGSLMGWHFFIMLFYLGMRLVAVKLKPGVPDTEILNNPYLLASQQEQWATKVYVLLKYFTLCWFPHPLSSDYSFNTIQFRTFASWDTLVSLVLHIGLLYAGFKLVLKKHTLGFAIAVYFAFLLMIGNILMDIGATMGERLLFHSTIGFVIAFAWLILKGVDKIPGNLMVKRSVFFLLLGTMTFLYGCKTWERNWDWKNDITLFLKDVETVPNSVLVLGNAGARYIDLSDTKNFVAKRTESLEKGIKYLKHAIELHPRYVNGYLNLGLGSYKLKRDRDALFYWKQAEALYPNNPYLKNYYIVFYNDLLNRGYQKAQRGQLDSAIYELRKTIILDKLNPEGFYNLGGAYYQNKQYDKAKIYWEQCLKLKPDHVQAKSGLATIVTVTVPTPPQPQRIKK